MTQPYPVLLLARQLDQGGTERQLAETAKALDPSVYAPQVGVFRAGGLRWRELESAGIPLVSFNVESLASAKGFVAIARYIRRHGIRLVHAFDAPAALFGVPAARAAGGAVVLSSQRYHRSLLKPPIYRHWLRLTDRIADGIVVNCEFARRHLIEDEGVPASRIRLCYNGIDLEAFSAGPERVRPESLQDAALVIGVVCSLRPEKGLVTLIDAFAQARGRQPGVKLAIVGSGESLAGLQARAAERGVLHDCVFQPATAAAPAWLRAIDIFVLPSLTEALSNSLMEAMACGCCAVASRVGGNPELVADGETGLLFEPGHSGALASALARLMEQPRLRETLARNGAAFIRREFRAETAARRMGEIYEEFLARKAFVAAR